MTEAAGLKEEGNAKFKAQQYAAAVDAYSKCLELDPKQHLVLSNRSAAYLKLGGAAEQALRDAEDCVRIEPSFPKGYSRQAAALQQLKRWEEAIKACELGLGMFPDDKPLKQMLAEVRNRHFQDRLLGVWHGKVHPELGNYEQEMEFMEGGQLRVEVMGRSVTGSYNVDCDHDPVHLSISVQAPPMPYICKLDSEGLHLCCPFYSMDRPTTFDGPGYCLMRSGPLPSENFEELAKMSNDEKLVLCVREITGALPDRKMEEPLETDSQDVIKEKMMAQVKFEGAMYGVQKKFGEECTKEVLGYAKGDGHIPAALAKSKDLQELRVALKTCGLLDEIPPTRTSATSTPSPAPRPAPTPPSQPATTEPPREGAASGRPLPSEKAPPLADSQLPTMAIAGALAISAAAVAVGWFFWQRRRR
mmetsp:Transcript_98852/g.247860  ORF Transcript_98852/g.247860 Transcript_98852/m.247860 type:complete len:417 (+) Transcript_98852:106-1356(+)